jgi:hypothetical protein
MEHCEHVLVLGKNLGLPTPPNRNCEDYNLMTTLVNEFKSQDGSVQPPKADSLFAISVPKVTDDRSSIPERSRNKSVHYHCVQIYCGTYPKGTTVSRSTVEPIQWVPLCPDLLWNLSNGYHCVQIYCGTYPMGTKVSLLILWFSNVFVTTAEVMQCHVR